MSFIHFFDLLGTFAFAISGALLGVKKRMDIYGLFVLALAVAMGGGTIRDVMLGSTPPLVLKDPRYLLVVVFAVLLVAYFNSGVRRRGEDLTVADAIGLGIFTFIGASTGLSAGLDWYGILLIAVLTSTGGGMIKDLLAGEIPLVLRKEVYASASLVGGVVFLGLNAMGVHSGLNAFGTSLVVIGIRLFTLRASLNLPRARL